MNVAILIGRLTRDPEMRYTPQGKAVTGFSLAVDRPGSQKETDFLDVVCWDKTAEVAAQYLKKGRQVAVQGRIQVRQYEKDGQKRRVWEIVASNIQFLGDNKKQDADDVPF